MSRGMAIDPSTSNLGYCIYEYDDTTDILHIIDYGILTRKINKRHKHLKILFGDLFTFLFVLKEVLEEMITFFNVKEIVSESAFVHKFVDAYTALVLCIHSIREISHSVLNKDIAVIAPREAKLGISGTGDAKKLNVEEAVLKNPKIIFKLGPPNGDEKTKEHIFDAVAVAYTYIQKKKKTGMGA